MHNGAAIPFDLHSDRATLPDGIEQGPSCTAGTPQVTSCTSHRRRDALDMDASPPRVAADAATRPLKEPVVSASPEVTYTEFTCKLITIRTKKSFDEVTGALEGLFQKVDLPRLAEMTAAGDQAGIQQYFVEISGDHEFSIFFQLDQGSTQRLAGYPINCRFYLIGNAVIVNGLFEYGAMAGLGAPVRVCISQSEGEDVRIDVDEPTAFFTQFPELKDSKVPGILDKDLINHLVAFAS
jgi:hypothetical protein